MGDDLFFYVCGILFVILVAAIIIGIWYQINYAKFKPKFRQFSDGSVQMEFYGVAFNNARQMARFNAEYQVGQDVTWNGRHFVIEQISPKAIMTKWGMPQAAVVAYLREQ